MRHFYFILEFLAGPLSSLFLGNHYPKSLLFIYFRFTIAAFFGLLIGIFFLYHVGALLRNETNIERLFPISFVNRNLTFDIGPYQNFIEIFGEDWRLWFIPVFTTKGKSSLWVQFSFFLKLLENVKKGNYQHILFSSCLTLLILLQ